MRQIECAFEADVLSAVIQSRWPDRVDAELREHVKTCEICLDVAAVAGAIECSREEVPAMPDSGRVWWKAQMRARREAVEAAGRPITVVQVAAFACAAGLMGACIGATSSWFQSALQWARDGFVPYAESFITGHWLLAICMMAMVLVLPVAVYLVAGKD